MFFDHIFVLAAGEDGIFESGDNSECQKEDLELPVFDLGTVAIATNNFSEENKLGEGGFGPVYKVTKQCILSL